MINFHIFPEPYHPRSFLTIRLLVLAALELGAPLSSFLKEALHMRPLILVYASRSIWIYEWCWWFYFRHGYATLQDPRKTSHQWHNFEIGDWQNHGSQKTMHYFNAVSFSGSCVEPKSL